MYSAIETAIADSNPRNTPREERGDMVGGIVRLSFHDAGEFDQTTADALGPDGCVDLTKGDNAGLAAVIADLDGMWAPFCDIISKADFWVLAAKVSVEVTAVMDYEVPFRYGRTTAAECGYDGDRLPAAEGGAEEIERVFVTAMGLTFRDAVALLGAHTLGRLETENSGFEGAWTNNPDTFDNNYFVTMTQSGWDLAVVDDTHTTWVRGDTNPTIFLNADMELAYHVADEVDGLNRCGPVGTGGGRNGDGRCLDNIVVNSHAIEFGNSQAAWLAAFATAFQGMTEVGFSEGDLCDPADAGTCGEPTPNPTTAAPVSEAPTTTAPTTAAPTTAAPTTAAPTTPSPSNSDPTAPPITASPTTDVPTSSAPTPLPTPSPTGTGTECTNTDAMCPLWSTLGYCTGDHDDYMSEHCQLSCQLCLGNEHATPPRNTEPNPTATIPAITTITVASTEIASTVAPTVAPIVATQPPALCHQVECGREGRCGVGADHCALDTVQHPVRCCADTDPNSAGFTGWTNRGGTCPWAESNNYAEGFTACEAAMTFSEAETMCTDAGARLCTQAEVAASCTQGTGCNFDGALVWTSTIGEVTADSLLAADTGFDAAAAADWSFENDDEVDMVTATPTTPNVVDMNLLVEGSSSSSSSSPSSDDSSNAGAVAGGVGVAVMVMALIAVGAVLHYRRRSQLSTTDAKAPAMDDGIESQLAPLGHLSSQSGATDSHAVSESGTEEMSASLRLQSVRRTNPAYINSMIIDAPTAASSS